MLTLNGVIKHVAIKHANSDAAGPFNGPEQHAREPAILREDEQLGTNFTSLW